MVLRTRETSHTQRDTLGRVAWLAGTVRGRHRARRVEEEDDPSRVTRSQACMSPQSHLSFVDVVRWFLLMPPPWVPDSD